MSNLLPADPGWTHEDPARSAKYKPTCDFCDHILINVNEIEEGICADCIERLRDNT